MTVPPAHRYPCGCGKYSYWAVKEKAVELVAWKVHHQAVIIARKPLQQQGLVTALLMICRFKILRHLSVMPRPVRGITFKASSRKAVMLYFVAVVLRKLLGASFTSVFTIAKP